MFIKLFKNVFVPIIKILENIIKILIADLYKELNKCT